MPLLQLQGGVITGIITTNLRIELAAVWGDTEDMEARVYNLNQPFFGGRPARLVPTAPATTASCQRCIAAKHATKETSPWNETSVDVQ